MNSITRKVRTVQQMMMMRPGAIAKFDFGFLNPMP
jgi:hypothetical protein